MFFPGETIAHKFTIPFDKNDVAYVVVSYKQNDHIVCDKHISSGFEEEEDGMSFTCEFTQRESLMFDDNSCYTIQCNVYTKNGTRHTSSLIKDFNGQQHLREVMTDD